LTSIPICRAGDVETAAYDRVRDQAGLSEGAGEFPADQFRADLPRARETRKEELVRQDRQPGSRGSIRYFITGKGKKLCGVGCSPERSGEPPGVAPSAIFAAPAELAGLSDSVQAFRKRKKRGWRITKTHTSG